jgi:DNA-directed RNA polymerase subunit omega
MNSDLIALPLPIDKTKIDSRFRVVILASERAKVLLTGAKPVIETSYKKEGTIALQEVMTADIEFLTGKEARKELRKAKTSRALEGTKSAADRARDEEVKSELEKDLNVYLSESSGAGSSPEPE